jgi:hypothetical protein
LKIVWRGHHQVVIDSASEEAAVEELTAKMRERIPVAMKAFLGEVDAAETSPL